MLRGNKYSNGGKINKRIPESSIANKVPWYLDQGVTKKWTNYTQAKEALHKEVKEKAKNHLNIKEILDVICRTENLEEVNYLRNILNGCLEVNIERTKSTNKNKFLNSFKR